MKPQRCPECGSYDYDEWEDYCSSCGYPDDMRDEDEGAYDYDMGERW